MSGSRNQREDVLNYLKEHPEGITQMDAYLKFPAPITRLSAVIFDLRKRYNISSTPCEGENCYGHHEFVRYKLEGHNFDSETLF